MNTRNWKLVDDTGVEKIALQEANRKAFKESHTKNHAKLLEGLSKAYKIPMEDMKKIVDFKRDGFSIKAFREASYALAQRFSLFEAQGETVFGQLLRAGVQNTFNDIYQAVEVTYDAVVRQTQSNKRQEFYSPLERVGFPKTVPKQGEFPETDFKGLDNELINVKYGMILAIERELLDDDQTGQIVERAGQMGENARIHEEALVWGNISGQSSLSFDGEAIPASKTFPTPYVNGVPGTSGGLHGSGRGVNALGGSGYAAGRISQSTLVSAWILAKKMFDQSGRPLLVMPTTLAVTPQDVFLATVLLNSEYNPSSSSTQTADIGKTGSIMSVNPLKNLTALVATRFMPDYSAILMQAQKGYAFQRRDPTEVIQENPQSGPGFSQEIFRYKERSRWVSDWIDPKFSISINPSLSSS